jgi:hypothetical protein
MNELKKLSTVQHQTPNGPFYAIMMGIEVHDPATIRDFIHQVLEKFKMQWMIGPPGTSHLLVTLVGDLSAAQFVQYWQEKAIADSAMIAIMSLMKVADVLHGSATGEILDRETLLKAA